MAGVTNHRGAALVRLGSRREPAENQPLLNVYRFTSEQAEPIIANHRRLGPMIETTLFVYWDPNTKRVHMFLPIAWALKFKAFVHD